MKSLLAVVSLEDLSIEETNILGARKVKPDDKDE